MTLNLSKSHNSHDPQSEPTVKHLQTILRSKGYKVDVDGVFGVATDLAVRRFQTRVGIHVDGIVGPQTYKSLTGTAVKATPLPTGKNQAQHFADIALARATGADGASKPRYVFGTEVMPLSIAHPPRFDCSELVQWAYFHAVGTDWTDGAKYQLDWCRNAGRAISVSKAMGIKGALLFIETPGTSVAHHVAISLGNGRTAEARSTSIGCGTWPASGRGFTAAGLPPLKGI
jgi:cell wall-associated NlpC family hydrolase